MSRLYGMTVTVYDVPERKVRYVKRASGRVWPFRNWDWDRRDRTLSCYAESQLAGGESEEEFADRLAEAVWKANSTFCPVIVDATYLEELPFQTHTRIRLPTMPGSKEARKMRATRRRDDE